MIVVLTDLTEDDGQAEVKLWSMLADGGDQSVPFWRNFDKFCGWSGPKHMCVWL